MTNSNQARSRITALILVVALLFSVAAIPVFAEASEGEPPGVDQETEAPGDLEQVGGENTETTEPTATEGGDEDSAPPTQDPDQPEAEETGPADEADERGPSNRAPTYAPVTLGYSSIVAFAPLDEGVAEQEVTTGTPLEDLTLPDTLAATVEDGDGAQAQADVTVTRWSAATGYDPLEIGTYTFTPELAAGYTLADGVELPRITVQVFMGVMPLSVATVQVGDYVYFGQYGGEDILWEVTSTSGGVELTSAYVLWDNQQYHGNINQPNLDFDSSDINQALLDFVKNPAHFSKEEQQQIDVCGLPPPIEGGVYDTSGNESNYWTNEDLIKMDDGWRAGIKGSSEWGIYEVNRTAGVRPVIIIGGGLPEYDSPRITSLTTSDRAFAKGEGRAEPLTVAVQGEAREGHILRMWLEGSGIAEYRHTLTDADLTVGMFELEWSVDAADLEREADGFYLPVAEIVRTAGGVETVLHTWEAGTYRVYTEGGDGLSINGTPATTTKVSFGTYSGSPAQWYVIGADSATWTLLAAGQMGTTDFGSNHAYNGSNLQSSVTYLLDNNFSTEEQSAMADCDLSDVSAGTAKLWPLSVDEANNVNVALRKFSNNWWLRSSGSLLGAAVVGDDGFANAVGDFVTSGYGIRPAFQLNLASVLFTSDAAGTAPAAADTSLTRFSTAAMPQNLKLTLNTGQSELNGFSVTSPAADITGVEGESVLVEYACTGGAQGGEFLRVRLGQSGKMVYSGVIAVNLDTNGGEADLPLDGVDLGIYDVEVWVEQEVGAGYTNLASEPVTFQLTVKAPVDAETPSINSQPQGGSYTINTPATLTVGASVNDGGTLSYQWYSNTLNSNSGGTLIPGADSPSYSPPTATVGATYYYVVVTNTNQNVTGATTATATSQVAAVTVNALTNAQVPVIDAPPTGGSYTQNASVTLTVAASVSDGGALSYQWYSSATHSNSSGTLISGATASSYSPSTATVGTTYYYVEVTNTNNAVSGNPTASILSIPVAVTVTAGGGTPDPRPTLTLGGIDTDTVTIGVYYNITVSTTYTGGKTLAYAINGSLPTGMDFNTATGSISGIPQAGTEQDYSFTITVREQNGTLQASRRFTLTVRSAPVTPDPVVLRIATPPDDSIRAGYSYSKTFSITYTGSEPLVYEAQNLPANLSIDAATGEITGVPAAAGGPYTITVTVKEASGGNPLSASTAYRLTVTAQDAGTGGSPAGSSSSGRSSGSGGSSTPDSRAAKTQLSASAFSWDGRTLTIDHDSITVLGLLSVQWNGETLTRGTQYSVHEGSVIVRFGEDFIAAQAPGDHTVRVEFLNHTGETTVKLTADADITDTDPHNPNTGGDTHNPNTGNGRGVWPALLLGSLSGAALVRFRRESGAANHNDV